MTALLVAVLLILAALGCVLIHRLDARHDTTVADVRGGDAPPGIGPPSPAPGPGAPAPDRPAATARARSADLRPAVGARARQVMAILRERQVYRDEIMQALHRAARAPARVVVDGARLGVDLGIPVGAMAPTCARLEAAGFIDVAWGADGTPGLLSLTPRGAEQTVPERARSAPRGAAPPEEEAAP
ncbi:hypothetical protein ABZ722_05055 [Streptomyces longwoodensis]|uniref:hypothetical protein n=1 Tax=Streptomyces longwoodensis TaxID=68231 RepID=UPI0033D53903